MKIAKLLCNTMCFVHKIIIDWHIRAVGKQCRVAGWFVTRSIAKIDLFKSETMMIEGKKFTSVILKAFKCSTSTESRLRSFHFKIFHGAIAFRDFLFKIKRIYHPVCCFCQKSTFWVQKVHFLEVPHPPPPQIDPGNGPVFILSFANVI